MLSQCLYDIPTQSVYIDPSTFDPIFLFLVQKLYEARIIEIVHNHPILAITEVHNNYLAILVQRRGLRSPAIMLRRIESRLLSRMPIRSQRASIHSLEGGRRPDPCSTASKNRRRICFRTIRARSKREDGNQMLQWNPKSAMAQPR